jgi:hypothetical protein
MVSACFEMDFQKRVNPDQQDKAPKSGARMYQGLS